MSRMIATFTDFGMEGPYLGQVHLVFHRLAPGVPVIDLMADAPAFDPRASAYLLAAFVQEFPEGTIFFAVVDPGVGGARTPMVARIDGRWFVGPDNGLFEPLMARAATVETWEITWRPERLSTSFHGRDLFAPIVCRLAAGQSPEDAGCRTIEPPRRPDWPADLAEVVYIDRYGNAMTGLRGEGCDKERVLTANNLHIPHADTFSSVPVGAALWYTNSSGLIEIAVNSGRADRLPLGIGTPIHWRE